MKLLSIIASGLSIYGINALVALNRQSAVPKSISIFSPRKYVTGSYAGRNRASQLITVFCENENISNGVDGAPAAAEAVAVDAKLKKAELMATLKVGSFFGLWYVFNIGYNIFNKQALNMLPLPYTMASIQLAVGLFYVFPLWATGLRKAPIIAKGSMKDLSLLGMLHMMTHITAVLSLGAGAVSFTHIVKAAEPVFTAVFSAAILGQVFAIPVYLSLLPVIGGVAMASLKELSFSWVAFGNAMGSNTFSALRGIVGKKQMGTPVGENMDAANLYAVLTVIALAVLGPVSLILEGSRLNSVWTSAIAKGYTRKVLLTNTLLSGLFYYLYNEVAFLALESVHPVTHAVGNTIKRVVVIVSSVLFFSTPMSRQSVIGSTIAIAGTLMYSLVKQVYDKKPNTAVTK